MHRAIMPAFLSLVMLLTTAMAVGAVVGLREPRTTRSVGAEWRSSADSQAAVLLFYDATNELLETGDASALHAVAAPDLVLTEAPAGISPNLDGLVRYLEALRAVHPGIRIETDDVATEADQVVAYVHARHDGPGRFLGLPISEHDLVWGTRNVFEVVDGQIAAFSGLGARSGLLEPLAAAQVEAPSSPALIGLGRMTLAPRAGTPDLITSGPVLLMVEAGVLVIDPSGAADAARSVTTPAGGSYVLPAETPYKLRNEGTEPVAVLGLALLPPGDPHPRLVIDGEKGARIPWFFPGLFTGNAKNSMASWPAGVRVEPVANGVMTPLPQSAVLLTAGRAILTAETSIPDHEAEGIVLIEVLSGSASLAIDQGVGRVRFAASGQPSYVVVSPEDDARAFELTAGGATLLESGAAISLRATDDAATVLIVNLRPMEVESSLDTAPARRPLGDRSTIR